MEVCKGHTARGGASGVATIAMAIGHSTFPNTVSVFLPEINSPASSATAQ